MWFYKCFSFGYLIFLVLVLGVDNMKQHKNNKKQSNVKLKILRNVTETNKTLQELINNFKHLEKVYENDETTDSDSSESEIDILFRQITHNKKKNRKRLRKQTVTTNDPRYNHRGTAYIYEYQESGVIGSEDAKDEKEEIANAKEENTSEESSLENDTKIKTSSEKISGSDEIKTESDEIVEIKIDSAEKHKSLAFKPKKALIKNKPESYPNNKGKTRFSVLQSGKHYINVSNESEMPYKIGNQRIVYSEQFLPETIWHEIINRPIKLNRVISSEEISKSESRENKRNSDIIKRSETEKEGITERLDEPEIHELTTNIAEDGHSIYRTGYGDDCIQVPVKKCKKAVKAVNKNVCKRRFKCESDFKSDFDENSKKECEKKFSYNQLVNKEVNYNIGRDKNDDNQFLDATRYRDPQKSIFSIKSDLSLPNNSQNSSIQLSLRDKYEKKCQKESKEKCIAACTDATESTCLKHTCNAKKKKALTKACKEECKNIFFIDKKSSASSDSSSSSESESD